MIDPLKDFYRILRKRITFVERSLKIGGYTKRDLEEFTESEFLRDDTLLDASAYLVEGLIPNTDPIYAGFDYTVFRDYCKDNEIDFENLSIKDIYEIAKVDIKLYPRSKALAEYIEKHGYTPPSDDLDNSDNSDNL